MEVNLNKILLIQRNNCSVPMLEKTKQKTKLTLCKSSSNKNKSFIKIIKAKIGNKLKVK